MHDVLPWVVAIAILASLPMLVRSSTKRVRGKGGGAMMMLGLAFGHLLDPAKPTPTEMLQQRRESICKDAEAGDPPTT